MAPQRRREIHPEVQRDWEAQSARTGVPRGKNETAEAVERLGVSRTRARDDWERLFDARYPQCRDQYGRDDHDVRAVRDVPAGKSTVIEGEFDLKARQVIVFTGWSLPWSCATTLVSTGSCETTVAVPSVNRVSLSRRRPSGS